MRFQPAGLHREAYDAVFGHPSVASPDRRDVQSMLATFADMTRGSNGDVIFKRNGQELTLHTSAREDVQNAAEMMAIRHFLQRAGANARGAVPEGAHLMVVIGGRTARIYQIKLNDRSAPERVVPYDPHGFAGHLHYSDDGGSGRGLKPECRGFYEAVVKTLGKAQRVVIVLGTARGARGGVNELMAELRLRHPALAERVAGILAVDERNPSEVQLLVGARDFYGRHSS